MMQGQPTQEGGDFRSRRKGRAEGEWARGLFATFNALEFGTITGWLRGETNFK